MAQREEPEHDSPAIDWIAAPSVDPSRADLPGSATTSTAPTSTRTFSNTSTTTASVGKGPGRWPAVVLGLAILVVLYQLVALTTDRGDEVVEAPRPIAPAIALVEADRTDRAPGAGTGTGAFERFPPFGFPEMHAVITDRSGARPIKVSTIGSILAIDDTSLVGLSEFSMDAGGEYLAALSLPDLGDPGSGWVLWVGAVDGELEPLVTGAQSYAWHDADPGRIAFIAAAPGQDEPSLFTIDLAESQPSLEEVADVAADLAGLLVMWGDWGFVLDGADFSTIVDSNGRLVVDEVDGFVVGHLPSLGLVFVPHDSPREPLAIGSPSLGSDEDGGYTEILLTPVEALANLLLLPDIVVGGIDGMVAVQAFGGTSDKTLVIVLDAAGVETARFPAARDRVPITWIDDGRKLAFIDDDPSDGTSLVLYDAVDDDVQVLLLHFLDPFKQRIEALTLR